MNDQQSRTRAAACCPGFKGVVIQLKWNRNGPEKMEKKKMKTEKTWRECIVARY